MSVSELIRLDTKFNRDNKSSKKLTEKLQKNFEKSKKSPKKIKAGEDNRTDILHEARFLEGHLCKNSEMWLHARRSIGISGFDPVSRYDAESVGMNDRINCNIWNVLHNPGAREISIKLFSPDSLKAARGCEDKESALPKKDFEEVNDLRIAVTTLRNATHLIHPWNFSVAAIEYFLNSINYAEKDIFNKNQRILFITDFIDEVLLRNAEAWDDSNAFWDAEKISNKWISKLALKFPRNGGGGAKTDKQTNQNSKTSGFQKKNFPQTGNNTGQKLLVPSGVCRRYNLSMCPNQTDATCTAPWDSTKTLKHVCCHQDATTKAFCTGNHPLPDHK